MAISNGSGTVTNVNTYDDYGIPGSANVGRFGYTGQVWLPELGMYYYKARIYSPTLGRFMQTDPIGYGDGLNWYNYVGSDPVNGTDPSGLSEILVNGTRERPNLCINCNSRIPLNFDFEPSEFSRVANEKGEGGEKIEPKRPKKQGCPRGSRLNIGSGVSGTGFLGVFGASAGISGGVSVPIASLPLVGNGSFRGTQFSGSGSITPLVGVGLFAGIGPSFSGGGSSGAAGRFSGSVTPVIQVGGGDGAGVEVTSDFASPLSIGVAIGRIALGAYGAVGARFEGKFSTNPLGCN